MLLQEVSARSEHPRNTASGCIFGSLCFFGCLRVVGLVGSEGTASQNSHHYSSWIDFYVLMRSSRTRVSHPQIEAIVPQMNRVWVVSVRIRCPFRQEYAKVIGDTVDERALETSP